MTYGNLKNLCRALLNGDFAFPEEPEQQEMLLRYGFQRIVDSANALKLFTENKDENLIRQSYGSTFIRFPYIPEQEADEIDLDDELCYALAEFMASFISDKRAIAHEQRANNIIQNYNAKVRAYIEDKIKNDEKNNYKTVVE